MINFTHRLSGRATMPRYVDFRIVYPLMFIVTNFLSLSSYREWDIDFLLIYIVLSLLFFISLWTGTYLLRSCQLHVSAISPHGLLRVAIILFVLSQLHYISYPYLFLSNDISDFNFYRLDLENHLNLYIGQLAYVFLILGLSYIIMEFIRLIEISSRNIKYFILILMIMLLMISVFELMLSGSRSTVLSLIIIIAVLLIRFNFIGIKTVIIGCLTCFFLLGFVAYLRIATSPESLEWWIVNDIVDPDASPFIVAIKMIWHTFQGIGERTVVLIDAVLDGKIAHQYGYDTFFYFVSILPGKQINPSIWLNHYLFLGSDQDVGYPPTIIGQMLWDFGLIGIPMMGFVIGLFGMWLFKKAHSSSIVWSIAYALFLEQTLLSLYGEFRFGWLIANVTLLVIIDYFIRGKVHFGRKSRRSIVTWREFPNINRQVD